MVLFEGRPRKVVQAPRRKFAWKSIKVVNIEEIKMVLDHLTFPLEYCFYLKSLLGSSNVLTQLCPHVPGGWCCGRDTMVFAMG